MAILGLLGVGAIWWYRLKFMKEAAGEVADAVGRVQGNLRRNKLRKKAALAPVTAIDDPVTAAATVVMAIAAEDVVVSDALEKRVRNKISAIAASEKALDEAIAYAKWASNQVADVPTVIDKTALLLKSRLDEGEKEQLLAMVLSVTPPDERHALFRRRVEQLQRKLGLEVMG
ncbi:hypothetical protein [Aquamicrobium sp. LC103]|uniref:hypothetical protein n=1 Tax=Aquamicrobium sp. LC103 TaxID=1120658 RepID=UPI001FEF7A13|nr:hypothetical protein [Aquamicrobium sp. LC103]